MPKRFLITALFIMFFAASFREPSNIFNISKGNITFTSDAPLELITASSNELRGLIETQKKQFAFSVKVRAF